MPLLLKVSPDIIDNDISEIIDTALTNDILKDDIILYPNPSNGEFSFKSLIKKYHLKIFNPQGEIFYNNQVNPL